MTDDSYLGAPEPSPSKRRPWPILAVAALAVIAIAGIYALTRGGDDGGSDDAAPNIELGLPGGPTDGSTPQSGDDPESGTPRPAGENFTQQGPQGPGGTNPSGGTATGTDGGSPNGATTADTATGGGSPGTGTGTNPGTGTVGTSPEGTRPTSPTIPRSPTTPGTPTTKTPSSGPAPTRAPTTTQAGVPSVSVDNTTLPDIADCYVDICLAEISGQMANAPSDAAVYVLTRLDNGPWMVQWYSDSYRGQWVTEAEFEPFCGSPNVEVRAALFNQWLPDEIEATFPLDELATRAPGTRTLSTSAIARVALRSNAC